MSILLCVIRDFRADTTSGRDARGLNQHSVGTHQTQGFAACPLSQRPEIVPSLPGDQLQAICRCLEAELPQASRDCPNLRGR